MTRAARRVGRARVEFVLGTAIWGLLELVALQRAALRRLRRPRYRT